MKFIFSLIFFALSALGIYFAYPIVKNRYFEAGSDNGSAPKTQEENLPPIEPSDSNDDSEKVIEPPTPDFDQTPKNSVDGKSFIDVTRDDCENECKPYAENAPDLGYCRQVCGLSSPPTKPRGDCDELGSLDRDYCLKDSAIKNSDFSYCEKIKDNNIKTTCISRITEDLMDKPQAGLEK